MQNVIECVLATHGKAAMVASLMKMSLVGGAREEAFWGGGSLCLAQNASGWRM